MAEYTKVFDNPYPNGWEDLPSENTPITASALQEHTDAIEHLEQYLEDNPIEKGGSDVEWNQIVTSGTKIAEVTIGEEKTDVYAPQGGGGGASTWSEVAEKPFETLGKGLRVQNDVLQSTDLTGTRAEFDAIKDSLPDGSAFDTTDEEVGGNVMEIYDGEERVIGTWFGKPLYRKSFQLSSNLTVGTSWVNTNINIPNINKLTKTDVSSNTSVHFAGGAIGNYDGQLYLFSTIGTNIFVDCITVEYTKVGD